MSKTLIKNLLKDSTHPDIKINNILDEDNLPSTFYDLSLDIEIRLQALNKYYNIYGQDECMEHIKKLGMMFILSGTKLIQTYLFDICMKSEINNFLKLNCAISLCSLENNNILGFEALNNVCKELDTEKESTIATPCKIEAICILMDNKKYKKESRNYFCNIINNTELDCDYRYKTVLSLENKKDLYIMTEAFMEFIYNIKNMTQYRILAGQCLIQKCKIKDTNKIENILLSFARDSDLDYNLRADSADVILQLGKEEYKIEARNIIMILGRQEGNVRTIFENAQNVHTDDIEHSVIEIVEFLSSMPLMKLGGKNGITITFEYVKKQLVEYINKTMDKKNDSSNIDKINISLNRIYVDRAVYSKYSCSLINILLKVWTYIIGHDSELHMKIRLLQELTDMSGTCSSGFLSRLVNSITGFGDFSLRISWEDQIVGNLTGRLNAKAKNIDDLEFQEKVLNEMAISCGDYKSRTNFMKFFRDELLDIRFEMYYEFQEHISDSDFDLYFRKAISMFEGVR
jgi:hypothetical protein